MICDLRLVSCLGYYKLLFTCWQQLFIVFVCEGFVFSGYFDLILTLLGGFMYLFVCVSTLICFVRFDFSLQRWCFWDFAM